MPVAVDFVPTTTPRWAGVRLRLSRTAEREAYANGRVTRPRFDGDVAAVPVDDNPPRDVQSEAGAVTDLLGGVERLEGVCPDVVRHSRAGVGDLHEHAILDVAGRTRSVPVPPWRRGRCRSGSSTPG